MSQNDTQVGGTHYKRSPFQPWDWEKYGVGGLEWTTIKYVSRYRDKDGLKDLKKARHYISKIREMYVVEGRVNRTDYEFRVSKRPRQLLNMYCQEWNLAGREAILVSAMVSWDSLDRLDQALMQIECLIREYESGNSASDVHPSEHVEDAIPYGMAGVRQGE